MPIPTFTVTDQQLRDYFAGQALPAVCGALADNALAMMNEDTIESVARAAYTLADAMLEARKIGEDPQ
jgi:hypothetical protein